MTLDENILNSRYEYKGLETVLGEDRAQEGQQIVNTLIDNYDSYAQFIVEGGDTTQYNKKNDNIIQREINGVTKARGETREIFVYEHKGTGIPNSNDGAGEVYIVAHGWNPGFLDFLDIADLVKTAKPAAKVLVVDWMQASETEGKLPIPNGPQSPNYKAVTWIGPIADKLHSELTTKGVKGSSINFIGHSFGSFIASATAEEFGKVNTITALDPASALNTLTTDDYGYDYGYDLDLSKPGRQRPVDFNKVSNYSRAYVGSRSIAGNQLLATSAHESFAMGFGVATRTPGDEHGYVVQTFKKLIDPNETRKLAVNPFSSQPEKPYLLSLDDNQSHPEFREDIPFFHQGTMSVNAPNEVNFLVASKKTGGVFVFATTEDDELSATIDITSPESLFMLGNNTLFADKGNDKIVSGLGKDTIYGGEGNDTLDGSSGNDILYGEEGNDSLNGSRGNDFLDGGAGDDTLNGSHGNNFLPERASDDTLALNQSSGNDSLSGGKGNDSLNASLGNDSLSGGEGNDTLNGFRGKDIAFFSDKFENYDYSISEKISGDIITFTHTRGTQTDGTDKLKEIEFGQFSDAIVPLPLEDGPEDTNQKTISGNNGNSIFASLTLPTFMFDRDADYKINLSSSPQNLQYNFAYIIDVSGSMDGTPLQSAKSAYTSLTNSLINSGVADVSQFKVIPFDDNVYPSAVIDANQAISTIQGLSSGGFTYFEDALDTAYNFFSGLPDGGTNIAYFLSDGQASDNFSSTASLLKSVADVQAYGIGNDVDTSQLRTVDSDGNISVLSNPSDLTAEFNNSDFSADSISKINLLLDGTVVETIQSSQLIEDSLGLSFESSIDNLNISLGAENLITAEIFFTDGTPTSTVDFTVASGLEAATGDNPFDNIVDGTGGDDTIRLGAIDLGINAGAGDDKVVGNDLNNVLDSGSGNDIVFGNDGNDTIITGNGQDRIDGGDGIDTVVYANKTFANSDVQKVGQVITVDNTDTLTNVEFIQFSDLKISTENLQPLPVLTVSDTTIAEGNSSNTTAKFTFNLSLASTEDVQFTYSTLDASAIAGEDYIAKTGQVTIEKGETTATLEVEIVADTEFESEEIFLLYLSELSGAAFENDEQEYSVIATIEQDQLYGTPNNDYLEGSYGNDTIIAESGDDTLLGYAGDDTLEGGEGNDILDGGTGKNTMSGGIGNDTYIVDSIEDTIVENMSSGTDTVIASIDYSIDGMYNVENLILIDNAINGTGNSGNNSIIGNELDNILDAGSSSDILDGGAGNDTLDGGSGYDTLNGGAGNDSLIGGWSRDTLYGGTGKDTLIGGTGNDTYIIDSLDDIIIENDSEGWDEVEASIDYSLAEIAHVEELNLTGNAIDGTGNSLDNYIRGNELDNVLNGREGNDSVRGKEGNDTLFSSAGKDTLYGGEGDDTYIIDNTETIIVENAGEGTDTIKASINYSIADIFSVRNLILIGNALEGTGSSSSDQITGNALDNILDGGSGGNDTLDGGAGNDTLIGGMGRDTYIVDSTGDTIIEDSSNYTDTVLSSINFSIAEIAYVENLTLTGDALLGTGNSERNVITGNALDNTLNGGSGRDTLIGGAGNDTLIGGADSDVYIVDSVDDVIIENESEGFDDVEASINYSLENIAHVEDLILTGDALKGTGNSLDNRVYGNDLNNTLSGKDGRDILRGYAGDDRLIGGNDRDSLNGGVGKDTLIGGTGNDTYYVENVSDIIIEDYDAGSDKVNSSITWTLGDNLERLTLTGTNAIDGIGNALDNRIEGNDAANKLFGNQGRDTLFGYEGDDWLSGGDGNDNLIGAEGNDTLVGGTGNDKLYGYQGDDMLVGGDGNDFLSGWNGGNDTLIGGAGNDTLSGSSGNDIFVFNNPNEGIDRITSFSPADDTIHISAAGFGGGLTAGDTILEEQILIGSSSIAADNASQRFIYNTNSGALLFDADGNQTGFDAVQIATLFNKPTISASDIFVTM